MFKRFPLIWALAALLFATFSMAAAPGKDTHSIDLGAPDAVIELGDGREGVFTVEVRALTGRVKIYPEAHESGAGLSDPDDKNKQEESEVKELW